MSSMQIYWGWGWCEMVPPGECFPGLRLGLGLREGVGVWSAAVWVWSLSSQLEVAALLPPAWAEPGRSLPPSTSSPDPLPRLAATGHSLGTAGSDTRTLCGGNTRENVEEPGARAKGNESFVCACWIFRTGPRAAVQGWLEVCRAEQGCGDATLAAELTLLDRLLLSTELWTHTSGIFNTVDRFAQRDIVSCCLLLYGMDRIIRQVPTLF